MVVAFMPKHTVLVEFRARLFEVKFKFHLNLAWDLKTRIGKEFDFGKIFFSSFSAQP